jgi:hypothetical protein
MVPVDYTAAGGYAPLSYFHNTGGGTRTESQPLASFIDATFTSTCAFDNCNVVTAASSSACNPVSGSPNGAGSETGGTVTLTTTTSSVLATSYFCLQCISNAETAIAYESEPFPMEIKSCYNFITITNPTGPYTYTVPTNTLGSLTNVITAATYATTTELVECDLTFVLRNSGPDSAYSGSFLSINAATGTIQVDVDELND